jgi:hypothetical protein
MMLQQIFFGELKRGTATWKNENLFYRKIKSGQYQVYSSFEAKIQKSLQPRKNTEFKVNNVNFILKTNFARVEFL